MSYSLELMTQDENATPLPLNVNDGVICGELVMRYVCVLLNTKI